MAKFKVTLPDGRVVEVEGTIDEVDRLLATYTKGTVEKSKAAAPNKERKSPTNHAEPFENSGEEGAGNADIASIVSKIKSCDEAEKIEKHILDKKSVVNRVLLPLYILSKYFPSSEGLTSGDIEKITKELGVPVAQANASKALSETARSYVDGDKVRRKGSAVNYKLVRRGLQHFEGLLEAKAE